MSTVALVCWLAVPSAFAQGGQASSTGSINGTVVDASGAVLPGVTVTAAFEMLQAFLPPNGVDRTETREVGWYDWTPDSFSPGEQAIAVLPCLVHYEAGTCLLEIARCQTERYEVEPGAAKRIAHRGPFHLYEPQWRVGLDESFVRRSVDQHVQLGRPRTMMSSRRIPSEVTACIPHHERR